MSSDTKDAAWILLAVLMCGCNSSAPLAKSADPAKPPSTQVAIPAQTAKIELVEEQHFEYPSCPDNMRLVFRSKRELRNLGWSDEMEILDRFDIEYANALCVPDSIPPPANGK